MKTYEADTTRRNNTIPGSIVNLCVRYGPRYTYRLTRRGRGPSRVRN